MYHKYSTSTHWKYAYNWYGFVRHPVRGGTRVSAIRRDVWWVTHSRVAIRNRIRTDAHGRGTVGQMEFMLSIWRRTRSFRHFFWRFSAAATVINDVCPPRNDQITHGWLLTTTQYIISERNILCNISGVTHLTRELLCALKCVYGSKLRSFLQRCYMIISRVFLYVWFTPFAIWSTITHVASYYFIVIKLYTFGNSIRNDEEITFISFCVWKILIYFNSYTRNITYNKKF